MNPSTKKAARKTVRVATTFTGAAAWAVTFGPAAHAVTYQPTAQPGHQPRQISNLKKAPAIPNNSGSITKGNCLGVNQSHWLHLRIFGHHPFCFGGKGTYDLSHSLSANQICGGNTRGFISGTTSLGVHRKKGFGKESVYSNMIMLFVSKVHISSFGGTEKCS